MEDFVDARRRSSTRGREAKAAEGIEAGILNRLHLHKMPTDEQIGLSTVFHLADDIASGETFHPSGGLKFDRSVTEGELLLARTGRPWPARGQARGPHRRRHARGAVRHREGFLGLGVSRWWC
jgi:hypothetical protein